MIWVDCFAMSRFPITYRLSTIYYLQSLLQLGESIKYAGGTVSGAGMEGSYEISKILPFHRSDNLNGCCFIGVAVLLGLQSRLLS